jgi:uncharacterized protein
MFNVISDSTLVALFGLGGGVLLGLAARLGRFCTLGAIEDLLYGQNDLRIRMWGVAIGVAVVATFLLISGGILIPGETSYLSRSWNPWASVAGGLVFGYGMALSGNCGFGALARLGGGDLRSFVIVLVMGISAYIALNGPLALLRVTLFPTTGSPENIPSLAFLVERSTGISATSVGLFTGLVIFLSAAIPIRRDFKTIFWGALVGLTIASGWAGTQWVAAEGFDAIPVSTYTFSAPIGDSVLYTMTSSGNSLSFGVGSVAGVLIGAFIGSLIKGHFRWEACEDPRELQRQISGAFLMGVGAVVAFGCSIGQGISAFSVLSYGAPVTLAAILTGAAIGLRQLITGFAPAD